MVNYLLEYEAETRAEAEQKSLEMLQLTSDDVKFEDISAGGGLRRLFKSSSVLIRTIPRKEKEEIPQESAARGVLYTILHKLNIDGEIHSIEEQDENLYIRIDSEQSGLLIGKYGRTLDALQFLLNLLVSKWGQDNKRMILDVGDYRVRRRRSLEEISEKSADKAARTGRSVSLNYMSPYERRIVHLLLDEDERVYTESSGDGVYKRVNIYPQKRRGHGNRRYEEEDRNRDYEEDGNDDRKYDEEDKNGDYEEDGNDNRKYDEEDKNGDYEEDGNDNRKYNEEETSEGGENGDDEKNHNRGNYKDESD